MDNQHSQQHGLQLDSVMAHIHSHPFLTFLLYPYISSPFQMDRMRSDGVNPNFDIKKVNVYLPSLMMKVPDHLYVLGDTYTCHT
jgi:hypothetical protein